MVRNVMGSLLALAGAAAAVWSPFRAWYDGRQGSDIRVDDLFTSVGVTPHDAALLGSLFLPMGFAALLALLGVLARSWLVVALAGLLVLGVTVLWMVRQAQFSGSLTLGGDGLDTGVGLAVAGGLLLFAGAFLISGLRRPRYGEPEVQPPADPPEAPEAPDTPPEPPSEARAEAGSGSGSETGSEPRQPTRPAQPPQPPQPPYSKPLTS